MYWKAIGNSVDTVYANTYISNRIYGRQIFPLGQTYEKVSAADLLRFREEAVDYGASGWSFWDWQETTASQWTDLAAPMSPLTSVVPNTTYPELVTGQQGRPDALDAGAPCRRDPRAGDQRDLRLHDKGQPDRLPGGARPSPERRYGSRHLGRPDGASPVAVSWTGQGPAGG